VLSSLHSRAVKIFALVKTLLPSLKPKLTYTEPNLPSIEVELTMETLRKPSTLSEMFDFLEQYCKKKHLKACIIFDEFQEISGFDEDNRLEREMRSAFQHHKLVSYAFLGSKMHLMRKIFKDKNRPFYNFGQHFELGTIDSVHWTPFIKAGLESAGAHLSNDECRQIPALVDGHPYYTQMICSELWESAAHGNDAPAGSLIEEALRNALAKSNYAFIEMWDAISPSERRLLVGIAESDAPAPFATEFLRKYQLGAASSVQRLVERLTHKGAIERAANGYRIVDPLFSLWITRGQTMRMPQ
jgi:AAA+ ATPase superfamily predicted ATPase